MITPGELQKGQMVTVHHWIVQETELNPLNGGTAITTRQSLDRSYCGDVLEVLAIALPYVSVVRRDLPPGCKPDPFRLDTRVAILMELSKEFVDSFKLEREGKEMP